jgi:hypothetical protein
MVIFSYFLNKIWWVGANIKTHPTGAFFTTTIKIKKILKN